MAVAESPLVLPPVYRLIPLREHADAFAEACRRAETEGAGAFFQVRRPDVLEFAVVLGPEEPLRAARRAVFAGMLALADALGSFAPPEKPVSFQWPATVLCDGARLGGGRLGWPDTCGENEVPDWLVFGAMLLAAPVGIADPGAHPAATWLQEEGFLADEHDAVVESFARHLMLAFDAWTESRFRAVADRYLTRLPGTPGEQRGIDGDGDLLIHRAGRVERVPLLPDLAAVGWLDPATGRPRLTA